MTPTLSEWMRKFFCLSLLSILVLAPLKGSDSLAVDSTNQAKVRQFVIFSAAAYGVALYGLNEAWYDDFPRSEFHFFNDNHEWKQLDKAGHFYSAFHLSNTGIHLLKKAGVPQKKAHFWGGMVGIIILTPIEILDGFSEEYGASWGDIIANVTGSTVAMGQHMLWNEVRIKPKFSFTSTSYASYRPNVLGGGFHEQILKDYNGQTYWLSVDLYAFRKSKKFPKWLNIAFGYGAQNMVYANDQQNEVQGFDSYRQYYLALDPDLSHIQSKSKFLNTFLYLVDLIHLPAPALEYNRVQGWKFHALSF